MPKLLKIETKNQITELRKTGHSIPEISRLLAIPKSTASRYANRVAILPAFKQRWLDRRNASKIISEKNWQIAKEIADQRVENLSEKELMLVGAALYWAEGAKQDLSFINSDPEMVKVYVLMLKKVYNIKDEDLKVSIRLFEDAFIPDAIMFWSKIVGLDLKNNVSINILKGSKKGKLVHGMCRIRVKKAGLLLKTITAINKRVISLLNSS